MLSANNTIIKKFEVLRIATPQPRSTASSEIDLPNRRAYPQNRSAAIQLPSAEHRLRPVLPAFRRDRKPGKRRLDAFAVRHLRWKRAHSPPYRAADKPPHCPSPYADMNRETGCARRQTAPSSLRRPVSTYAPWPTFHNSTVPPPVITLTSPCALPSRTLPPLVSAVRLPIDVAKIQVATARVSPATRPCICPLRYFLRQSPRRRPGASDFHPAAACPHEQLSGDALHGHRTAAGFQKQIGIHIADFHRAAAAQDFHRAAHVINLHAPPPVFAITVPWMELSDMALRRAFRLSPIASGAESAP